MKTEASQPGLLRGIGLREGISLNVIEMIGVGPFITIPLIIHASGGPQAMLGWILGAALAMCDGMVWAELGAALPRDDGVRTTSVLLAYHPVTWFTGQLSFLHEVRASNIAFGGYAVDIVWLKVRLSL